MRHLSSSIPFLVHKRENIYWPGITLSKPQTLRKIRPNSDSSISAHNGIHYTQQQSQNGVWGDNVFVRRFVSVLSLELFLLFYTIFIWKAKCCYKRTHKAKKWTFTIGHKYLVYCSCCCMFILLYLMRFLNFSLP